MGTIGVLAKEHLVVEQPFAVTTFKLVGVHAVVVLSEVVYGYEAPAARLALVGSDVDDRMSKVLLEGLFTGEFENLALTFVLVGVTSCCGNVRVQFRLAFIVIEAEVAVEPRLMESIMRSHCHLMLVESTLVDKVAIAP